MAERQRWAGALVVALLTNAGRAVAAAGDLDPSFGSAGVVIATDGTQHEETHAALALPDGRLVVAGFVRYSHVWLIRLRTDGGLDQSFGVAGRVVTPFANGARVYAMAQQADGKLLVAGDVDTSDTREMLVARYQADGALDPTFGTGGIVQTNVGGSASTAYALVLDADGRVAVAGNAHVGGREELAVVRHLDDGSLDASFGGDGIVTVDVSSGSDPAFALARQPDGRLVAAGAAAGSGWRIALVRLDASGALDPTFSGDGIATLDLSSGIEAATAVVIQPGGRIVTAGPSEVSGTRRLTLAGFDTSGDVDPTFGAGGVTMTAAGGASSNATTMAAAPDGALFVGGWARVGTREHFALLRYTVNGQLDPSFGTGGIVTTAIALDASARAVALHADGRIALAGRAYSGLNDDTAVARYLGLPRCGNELLESGETCDDGNTIDGDCCSASCHGEASGSPCPPTDACTTGSSCDGSGLCGGGVPVTCGACQACDPVMGCGGPACTATPTSTAVATSTATPAATATDTTTPSATVTALSSPTVTPSPTPTDALAADCPATPVSSCDGAERNSLAIRRAANAARTHLLWRWKKGPASTQEDFGDPVSGETSFALCLYDQSAGTAHLQLAIGIAAGGTCGSLPCWRALGHKGWAFADQTGGSGGITKMQLLGGEAGRSRLQLRAKGPRLSLPAPMNGAAFDQDPAVIVQLRASGTARCWTSTFDAASTSRNDEGQFKAQTRSAVVP